MKLLISFLIVIPFVLPSHIYTRDLILDYSNAGFFSNMGVPFMLSTAMDSTDYLNLKTSFSLHTQIQTTTNYSITNYFTPLMLSLSLSTYSSDCQVSSSKTPAIAYTKSVDSTNYLVSFMDNQQNLLGLNANQWYVLLINITDSNVLNNQVANKLLQIQLQTVSSSLNDFIIYDKNPIVSIFQLLDSPPNSLKVSLSFDNPNTQNLLSYNNLVYLDITTSLILKNSGTIKYFVSDNSFLFNGQCLSVSKSDSPYISAFSPSNYSCSVNNLENSIQVTFSNPISSVFSIRIKTYIQNPSRVVQSSYIKALLLYSEQGIVAEYGQSSASLKTVNIPLAIIKLNLAWNINPANASSFPFPIGLVRTDSTTPGYYPYNSFVINLATQSTTPANVKLRMNIDLVTPTGSTFLTGSISETLPSFDSNTKVSCALLSSQDSSRKIQCTGVGQLVVSTVYKIGFKMTFPYDQYKSSLTTQDTFGVVYVETFNPFLNDYDSNYLIPRTSPQNLQSLSTFNNKNWLPTSVAFQKTAISSQKISSTIENPSVSTNLGITPSSDPQRLIFSLSAPYSEISSSSSTAGTAITDSAGLYILFNNIFQNVQSSTASFEDSSGNTDTSITVTITSSSLSDDIAYGLISYSASSSDGLLKAFSVTATDKIFAFKPIIISQSCSIYSDSGNYDFYLVSVDAIAGTYNQQTFNNYALINSQCVNPSVFSSIKFSISNFWTGNSDTIGSLSGSSLPAFLYISGKLPSSVSSGSVKKLAVFLQNVEPFQSLQAYFNSQNFIYCTNSDGSANSCTGVVNPNPDYSNYFSMNKIEFSIKDPLSQFSIVIPIKTLTNKITVYGYLTMMGASTDYSSSKLYYQITASSKLYQWSFSASSSALAFPYLITGITNPNYGIDGSCLTCYPGNTVDSNIKIGHTDSGVLSANDGSNFGAGFSYVSDNNLFTSKTILTSSISNSDDPCLTFSYSPDQSSYLRYGVYCPFFTGSVGTTSTITATQIKLPYKNGRYLNGIGAFSLKTGALASAKMDTGALSQKGTITNLLFTPNKFSKGITQSKIIWTFQTTNPISNQNYILISLSKVASFESSEFSYCLLRYSSGKSIQHQCSIITEVPQYFGYLINTAQSIAAGKFDLLHYSVDSDNIDGSDTTFTVTLFSQESADNNYIIDQSSSDTPGTFGYNNNPTTFPTLILSPSLNNYNLQGKTFMDIGFKVSDRGLYPNESINFDLSALNNDNTNNLDYECLVLDENQEKTPDFKSVSFFSFSQIIVYPKSEITTFTQSYYLRCYHIILPFIADSNGGFNITGYVADPSNNAITKKTIISVNQGKALNSSTYFSYFELIFTDKLLSSPGNSQTIDLSVISTNQDLRSDSRIIIWFPYYYPPSLNADGQVFCRINQIDVNCEVDQIRRLVVKYLPSNLTAGVAFTLTIVGPQQGTVQIYSNFYLALDQDFDESYYLELGSFADIQYKAIAQSKLVNLMLYSINFTSTYIREYIDTHFQFYLPDSFSLDLLSSYTYFFLDFPNLYNILLNVTTPSCLVYNLDEKIQVNYAASCSVMGSQIKVLLSRDLSTGYNYEIQINGVRGPSWRACISTRWVVNLVAGDQNTLVARSFFTTANKGAQLFSSNPSKILLSFYDSETGQEIQNYQLTPGVFSMPIIVAEASAFYKSFLLSKPTGSIFSNYPLTLYAKVGVQQTSFQIACPQDTTYGIHYFSLEKSGDGDYYTGLPILPVNISSDKVTFNFEVTSFSIPAGSTNFMIFIKEPTQMPNDFITLNFSLSDESFSETGLTLLQSSLTLNQLNPYGFINFSSSYNESFVGKTAQMLVNISGKNSNSYQMSANTFSLNIVANSTYTLSATITISDTQTSVLTSSFTISCSVAGLGYFQLTKAECPFIGISPLISKVKNFYTYDSNDLCQTQVGVVYFEANSISFCQDFNGNFSSVTNANFTSKNNGGTLLKVELTFGGNVSKTNKERLTCFFTTLLGVPPQRIMTSDLIYCQTFTTSRLLQNNLTLTITNLSSSSQNSSTSQVTESLTIYFLPIDDREIDNTGQTVSALTNTSDLASWIQGNITGLPTLLNVSQAISINENSPSFNLSAKVNVEVYDKWVSISNIKLLGNGSIYLMIYHGVLENDTTPSYNQIINNQIFNGSSGIASSRVQFSLGNNSSAACDFSSLSTVTSYLIVYFGTNENPSYQDFLKTEIRKVNFTTQALIKASFCDFLRVELIFLGILIVLYLMN